MLFYLDALPEAVGLTDKLNDVPFACQPIQQAWYAYDNSNARTVQHTTVGSTSATTVYAFGLEEYSYDGSSTLLSSTHYYRLAGYLLGELQVTGSNSITNFFLSDGLSSVLGVFSNTANSAALLSTQLFTPYDTQLVANGNSISQYTAKGFTGQYADTVSGLDYYVSRYYDPVAGIFLSADVKEGEKVLMYNLKTKKMEYQPILRLHSMGYLFRKDGYWESFSVEGRKSFNQPRLIGLRSKSR